MEQCFTDDQRKTAIHTRHRATDPVTFGGVEKQYLVCLGYRMMVPNMTHINAAIGKHQLCGCRALLHALVTTTAQTQCVPDRNRRSVQQRVNGKFWYIFRFVFRLHAFDPPITQPVYPSTADEARGSDESSRASRVCAL